MTTKHVFGGFWTQVKLERVAAYLPFFTREFAEDHSTVYFDAFAGTGTVDRRKSKNRRLGRLLKLPNSPPVDGSASRAMQTTPPFDRYVLIDKDQTHCDELRRMRKTFPELVDRVKVRRGDANERVTNFCETTDWSASRAVFFLDPYGMAVNWDTIEAIAKTEAADMWYLFPVSATLRMLQRREKPPKGRGLVLDRLFGGRDWSQEFYHSWERNRLIGGPKRMTTRHADEKGVIKYFVNRLQSVFRWVDEKPLRLFRTNGPILFHLYFASSMPGKRRIYETVRDILSIHSEAHDFPVRFEKLQAEKRKKKQ